MMIRDFKTRLFCREAGLPHREVDATDPLWAARVDRFFLTRSAYPPPDDPNEYAEFFEAMYPTEEERRIYIDSAVRRGTPSFGHRVLASLITSGNVPCVFTTNFDPLVETACTQTDQLVLPDERAHCTVAALDSAARAERCLRESDWPLIAKLHGDYQSVKLKNTIQELQAQDAIMRSVLTGVAQRFGLIVVGYSGRDASIMDSLASVLKSSTPFPGGIYWITSSAKRLLPAVSNFLEQADRAGVTARVVLSQNFDEFAADLLNQAQMRPALLDYILGNDSTTRRLKAVPVPTTEARRFPVLRCSALPVAKMPTSARRLKVAIASSAETVRVLLKQAKVRASVAGSGYEFAAFGKDAELCAALKTIGARVEGTVPLDPENDSHALGLLYDTLIRALCRRRPLVPRLRSAGHAILVAAGHVGEDPQRTHRRRQRLVDLQGAYATSLSGVVPELGYPYTEGVRVRIEQFAQRWWCVFEPFTFIDLPKTAEEPGSGSRPTEDPLVSISKANPAADWRRERWATRYNPVWTRIIDAWSQLLAGSEDGRLRAYDVKENEGIDAEFELVPITAWSRPAHHHAYFDRGR